MIATQGGAPETLWDKVRGNYNQAVLLVGVTAYLPFAYFTASAITPLIFLIGVFLLGNLKSLRVFLPVALCTAALLIMAFLRSDFVDSLRHGESLSQAAHETKWYFRPAMVMWAAIWAVPCTAWALNERQSERVFRWLSYVMLALTALLAAEALSHFGLRNWINRSFFKGARPEMVVVRVSDSNFLLLYLFWPLTMYFMARRWIVAVIAMVLTIVGLSIVVGTDAQIMALLVSTAAFLAVKYWPRGLWSRRIVPERVAAVMAGAFLLSFPFVILALVRSGLLGKIASHVGASSQARLGIWTFGVLEAAKKPFLGWGFESARNFDPIIPDHPHSPAIQAWLELGIPGLLLIAAIWFLIFWRLAPKGEGAIPVDTGGFVEFDAAPAAVSEDTEVQRARPYALALVVTFFTVNAISYGIWRDWIYTQGAFSAAAMILATKAVLQFRKFQI